MVSELRRSPVNMRGQTYEAITQANKQTNYK